MPSNQDNEAKAASYDQMIAVVGRALQGSSGIQRRQIEAQIEDLKAGRENAMKIAQLQAETSRYGVDAQRETAMAQLEEDQRQFDLRHGLDEKRFALDEKELDRRFGLDTQKFGLDTAEAYTRYASTPDMMFARNDFVNALGRTNTVGATPSIDTATAQPYAKTYDDFNVLKTMGPGAVDASGRAIAPTGGAATPGATGAPQAGAATGAQPDLRLKAMKAIGEAIPPSETPGADGQDWNAIEAIKNLYFAGASGAVQRLGKERQKIARAGLARAGFDPLLVEEDNMRRQPGQKSALAA